MGTVHIRLSVTVTPCEVPDTSAKPGEKPALSSEAFSLQARSCCERTSISRPCLKETRTRVAALLVRRLVQCHGTGMVAYDSS